jgi:hypothetical protein
MSMIAGQMILSWPTSAVGFTLETSTALAPDRGWIPVSSQIEVFGCSFVVTNRLEAPAAFFRLHKQ